MNSSSKSYEKSTAIKINRVLGQRDFQDERQQQISFIESLGKVTSRTNGSSNKFYRVRGQRDFQDEQQQLEL
jgi:hypothetical protein